MRALFSLNPALIEIVWPMVVALAYLGALITGIVKSFTTRQQPNRRNIRVVTAVLSTPIWLIIAALLFVGFDLFKNPPTLAQLRHDFPSRRADLETILAMSDEDANFSRIAPDFLDGTPQPPNVIGRHLAGDRKAGLPNARWDAYRKIFARNGIKLGIERNEAHDAFIMFDSVGRDMVHTSGYLHCGPGTSIGGHRFDPCTLRRESGKRDQDPKTGTERYSVQKLDDQWYAYDERF
jgi:hypothetical protein